MEDFDGWEVLPVDGFLQIHHDGGKTIFSRNYGAGSRCVFKDYFICPDSKSTKLVETTEQQQQQQEEEYSRSRVIPVTLIQLEGPTDHNQVDFKKITEIPFENITNPSPPLLLENFKVAAESDPDPVSQVLFKKMKEPEFVDLKRLESPTRCMKPPPFLVDADFQLVDGKGEAFNMKISSPRSLMEGEEEKIINSGWEERNSASENNGGFNIWKLGLTGIGAICTFGIATATVCIIFFGAHQRNSKQQYEEKHKLQFHIYSDEK